MNENKRYFKTNKATWNTKVKVHAKSDFYDLETFKSGTLSLNHYELNALGNVRGKSLLHLQCHFGQDTLSWSRMGAKCVGVDISDEAIKLAQELNDELHLDAKFVCFNVLETSKFIKETFDIVFTSYGVIGWLPDLNMWAKQIGERLNFGGRFYMVEFHPILWMFDYTTGKPKMKYHYSQNEVIYEEYKGTYADENSEMISKEYVWNHGLSEVINALIDAGLQIEYLNEHDESPYKVFPNLIKNEAGLYTMKDQLFPMVFEVLATRAKR